MKQSMVCATMVGTTYAYTGVFEDYVVFGINFAMKYFIHDAILYIYH